jgi:hydroxymethylbilane synthase
MTKRLVKFGTRGSELAKTQTQSVINQLLKFHDWQAEIVLIKTFGDDLNNSLTNPVKPGVFVSQLRDSLLENKVDVIIHSYKDLPSQPHDGIVIAAVPKREDYRDVLISRDGIKLVDLPAGAVVGTSSPRRQSFIKKYRPNLMVKPMRGNIDSRLKKIFSGEFDAAVMAAAGLKRINRSNLITEYFTIDEFIPAPAQGALAIECRSEEIDMIQRLKVVEDEEARFITTIERSFLRTLGASCLTAVGAVAIIEGNDLTLRFELSDEKSSERETRVEVMRFESFTQVEDFKARAHELALELLNTRLGKRILGING